MCKKSGPRFKAFLATFLSFFQKSAHIFLCQHLGAIIVHMMFICLVVTEEQIVVPTVARHVCVFFILLSYTTLFLLNSLIFSYNNRRVFWCHRPVADNSCSNLQVLYVLQSHVPPFLCRFRPPLPSMELTGPSTVPSAGGFIGEGMSFHRTLD